MSRKTTNFFSGFLPLQCFFTHSTRLLIELGFLFLRNAVEKLFWKIWYENKIIFIFLKIYPDQHSENYKYWLNISALKLYLVDE